MPAGRRPPPRAWLRPLPGLLLCAALALAAHLLHRGQGLLLGQAPLDVLVIAILLGAALRTAWTPGETWRPGIRLAAGLLLEVAVALLGASLELRAVAAGGGALLLAIAAVVALALAAGYGLGRACGLPHRMALLVAGGNAICGNSAIAAIAPVIGAGAAEVAAAIAFTAVLGVLVVLALPLLVPLLGLAPQEYGVLAGLTVYAVPQVLAATAPFGSPSMQAGTLVKLLRVLMLAPLMLGLSLLAARRAAAGPGAPSWRRGRLLPWFIPAFLALALLQASGLLPAGWRGLLQNLAGLLTLLAMAALGLGVELRGLARAGGRVVVAAGGALLALLGLALGALAWLGAAPLPG